MRVSQGLENDDAPGETVDLIAELSRDAEDLSLRVIGLRRDPSRADEILAAPALPAPQTLDAVGRPARVDVALDEQ